MYTTAIVVNTVTNVGMASTRVVMPVATSIRTPMVPGTIPIKYCSPLRNPNPVPTPARLIVAGPGLPMSGNAASQSNMILCAMPFYSCGPRKDIDICEWRWYSKVLVLHDDG